MGPVTLCPCLSLFVSTSPHQDSCSVATPVATKVSVASGLCARRERRVSVRDESLCEVDTTGGLDYNLFGAHRQGGIERGEDVARHAHA